MRVPLGAHAVIWWFLDDSQLSATARALIADPVNVILLIVDGHPVRKSAAAKRFVAANATRRRLILLRGYCPELNPDELLNQGVKTNPLGKSRPTSKAEMIDRGHSHLHRRQKQPQFIRNLLHEQHVRCAA